MNIPLDDRNIIGLIADARYGLAYEADKKISLLNELTDFNSAILGAKNANAISATAIRSWFRQLPTPPRRSEAKHFLHAYVLWVSHHENISLDGTQRQALDRIRIYLEPFVGSLGHARRSPDRIVGSVETWDSDDVDAPAQFSAIEGDYQIIRPSSSSPDEFVLEAMAIVVHERKRRAALEMYSHTQISRDYLYSGGLYLSYRYGFSLIQRQHDRDESGFAVRCVVIYVDAKKSGPSYLASSCLSGIMLRGVAGQKGASRAMGAPFIAIKAPGRRQFKNPDFLRVGNTLHRLHRQRPLLVGEIAKPASLFGFCEQLFSQLHLVNGRVLQTVHPEMVQIAIKPGALLDDAYIAKWTLAVESHFAHQQRQLGPAHKKA
jgi:hypothetical protein